MTGEGLDKDFKRSQPYSYTRLSIQTRNGAGSEETGRAAPGSGEGPPEARAARRGWRCVADGGSRKATSPRPGHPASWYHHFQGQEPWASALTIATLLRTLRQVKAAVKPPARKGGETRRKINREKMNLRWCRFLGKQLGTCGYSCSGTLRKVTPLVQPFIPAIYQKEGS